VLPAPGREKSGGDPAAVDRMWRATTLAGVRA
jgi:hypothetical protein